MSGEWASGREKVHGREARLSTGPAAWAPSSVAERPRAFCGQAVTGHSPLSRTQPFSPSLCSLEQFIRAWPQDETFGHAWSEFHPGQKWRKSYSSLVYRSTETELEWDWFVLLKLVLHNVVGINFSYGSELCLLSARVSWASLYISVSPSVKRI